MKIAVNSFVKRQTPESRFSHFDGTWEELVSLTKSYFKHQIPGYRDGVILVSVPPKGFYSSVLEMNDSMDASVIFESRMEGEDPVISIVADGVEKTPAKRVEIVLYRHDVLAEDGDANTDAEWEIVSINVSPTDQEIPMSPTTRARNILHLNGGTDAKIEELSKDELVNLVKTMAEEVVFWSTHVQIRNNQ